jgi:hypothetical protein
MRILRDFFDRRLVLNGLVFAIPIGALILWRVAYTENIAYFSAEGAYLFAAFVGIFFLLYVLLFFILFLLSRGEQKHDD